MGQTNTNRIIELLETHPGLDDDEISKLAEIKPRQQVNQICRRLEERGILRRAVGPRGKIANYLTTTPANHHPEQSGSGPCSVEEPGRQGVITAPSTSGEGHDGRSTFPLVKRDELPLTLVIIPCSGRKIPLGAVGGGPSILDHLPPDLGNRLAAARSAVRGKAQVDEHTLVPAWKRYGGALYAAGRDDLARAASICMC